MNTPDQHEWHRLFNAALNGQLTEAEHELLASVLKSSAEARQLWFLYADNECSLADQRPTSKAPSNSGISWLSWRSAAAAAAAGLVLGLCCSSVVFAYAGPWAKAGERRSIPLFTESFEDVHMKPRGGFPNRANEWFGDVSPALREDERIQPAEGKNMARLVPSERQRKFSYAYRIVDITESPLPEGAVSRQVEVEASFHGGNAKVADHYQIRLAAFAEPPEEIRSIWNDEATLFDRVLQHFGRNEISEPEHRGWHRVKASMEIPAGTRCLVISLAAAVADKSASKTVHYLDDVAARLLITEAAP